jgi:peptidoglycan/xylan/chitin deacetylase (PgdA/CDA1 family)
VKLSLPEIGVEVAASGWQEKRGLWWKLVQALSAHDSERRRGLLDVIREQLGGKKDREAYFCNDALRRRFLILDQKGLQMLAEAGMTVGAHTSSHGVLAKACDEVAWNEIQSSRESLGAAVGRPIWAFAYPFGGTEAMGPREIAMSQRAGFACAFVNTGGGFGAKMPRFAIPRVHVTAGMTISEFEAHLSGFYREMRRSFLGKRSAAAEFTEHAAGM